MLYVDGRLHTNEMRTRRERKSKRTSEGETSATLGEAGKDKVQRGMVKGAKGHAQRGARLRL